MAHARFTASIAWLAVALCTACLPEPRSAAVVVVPDDRPNLQAVLVDTELKGSARFQKAIQDYRAYLAAHPEDADGHLEFGMLLTDMELFGEALFHLRLYESSGENLSKADLLKKYLETCAKNISAENTTDGELVAELTAKNLKIANLNKSIEALQKQNQDLTAENEKLRKTNDELKRRQDMILAGADTSPTPSNHSSLELSTVAPARQSSSSSNNGRNRGTYKVRAGDTLRSIAETVYGDASRARDIRNANPGKISANGAITVGDILICP